MKSEFWILIGFICFMATICGFGMYSAMLQNEPFHPKTCHVDYQHGKYVIWAKSTNFFQSNRNLGGANTSEETMTLAKEFGCPKLRDVMGGWHDLDH